VRDLGFRESVYGLLFTVNTAIIILLEVPLNLSMAHWPHRVALPLGSILVGLGFGALAVATSLPAIIGTVVIWTFGEMILLPGSGAYTPDLAPAGRRGQYMGFYTMAFGAAFALGPWLGTLVLESAGARTLWLGCVGAGALSTLMLMRLRGGEVRVAD
jgi:MFS family permease